MYRKVYVDVAVHFHEGRMIPFCLLWEDGKKYRIDRVISVSPAHAQKVGGQGDRYKVQMEGREKELFFEHNPEISSPNVGRWFVEARV